MLSVKDHCQTVLPCRMVYTTYKKQCILHFYLKGCKAPTIQKFLAAKVSFSCNGIAAKFIKVYEYMGSICLQPGSGRPSKDTCVVKDFVMQQMVGGLKIYLRNKVLQNVRGGLYLKGA